jgi:hypothetical protein
MDNDLTLADPGGTDEIITKRNVPHLQVWSNGKARQTEITLMGAYLFGINSNGLH